MTVVNKMKNNTVAFRELAIGDAYYDKDGYLCIKTSDPDWDAVSYGGCIAHVNGEWVEEEEHEKSECTPLKTEFVILGYM
jgi:hypothetical protein